MSCPPPPAPSLLPPSFCHSRFLLPSFPTPPSVIPDVSSRESILLFLCPNQGEKQQKDGFPIKNVGNDGSGARKRTNERWTSEHLPLANTSRLKMPAPDVINRGSGTGVFIRGSGMTEAGPGSVRHPPGHRWLYQRKPCASRYAGRGAPPGFSSNRTLKSHKLNQAGSRMW